VLEHALERFPAEWQVVQEPSGLRVLLSSIHGPIDDAELAEGLRQALLAQGAAAPPIAVERVRELPKGPSGKIARVRSTVPRPPITG
jgi:acyl-coenzyme A synthetase/AMP-(fatty) acid ligase